MPRSEEANQRIREAQREKILEAARKVFAQKGRSATMADVAEAAEVSQGLAYRYFPNKEAIFQTLVTEVLAQTSSTGMVQVAEMPGTPGERLEAMITRMWNVRRDSPEFFQLFYWVLADENTPDELRNKVSMQGEAARKVLRQLIVEGQATGEIVQDDPDQLLDVLMSCIEGLWRRIASNHPNQVKSQYPDVRIILRILKPEPK